jgi:hypothetical protein
MAIIHFINRPRSQNKVGMLFVLRYAMQDKKTARDGRKYVSGVGCTPQSAYTEFNNTKLLFSKDSGRMYYHFVQSFPIGEDISPKTAHEIALKFIEQAEKFKGFEVVVATHCDRDHIHSHFVMNSVNAENGRKFHINTNEVEELMKISDSIIEPYGLSICVPDKSKKLKKTLTNGEYYAMKSHDSWKLKLAIVIDDCMKNAKSKRHFKWLMEQEGYQVKWTDKRKNITYTTPDGKKCGDDKLHEEKYLKENMENEFRIRQTILYGIQESGEQTIESSSKSRADNFSNRRKLQGTDSADRYTESMAGVYFAGTGKADDRSNYGHKDGTTDTNAEAGVRESAEADDEYFRITEDGRIVYIETGWETERSELLIPRQSESSDDSFYEKAIRDFSRNNSGLLVDSLYLAADIENLIDEDGEIQDCTTIHYPTERKKKQEQGYGGPVMGGM